MAFGVDCASTTASAPREVATLPRIPLLVPALACLADRQLSRALLVESKRRIEPRPPRCSRIPKLRHLAEFPTSSAFRLAASPASPPRTRLGPRDDSPAGVRLDRERDLLRHGDRRDRHAARPRGRDQVLDRRRGRASRALVRWARPRSRCDPRRLPRSAAPARWGAQRRGVTTPLFPRGETEDPRAVRPRGYWLLTGC